MNILQSNQNVKSLGKFSLNLQSTPGKINLLPLPSLVSQSSMSLSKQIKRKPDTISIVKNIPNLGQAIQNQIKTFAGLTIPSIFNRKEINHNHRDEYQPNSKTFDMNRLKKSISLRESYGGDYNAVNLKSSAFGKYQFIPSEVEDLAWKYLKKKITPQELAKSPQLQEQLFEAFMNYRIPKEGIRNAVSRWFTGKPYRIGFNRSDGSFTGAEYYKDFRKNYFGI